MFAIFSEYRRKMHNSTQSSLDTTELQPRQQVAALCYRENGAARQVLMITSRGSGRWITPKGWPMANKKDHEAALQEAWEEAGVVSAEMRHEPIGRFSYAKKLKTGAYVPVSADVYLAKVTELANRFPERHQRRRKWMAPAQAAEHVAEPRLQDLLISFGNLSDVQTPTHDGLLSV